MTGRPERQGSARAWLELLRIPNFTTVPGDPIAGILLAAQGASVDARAAGGVLLASLLFYAGGLLLNDAADLEVDRRERPGRPLPREAVSVVAARNTAFACLAGGILLSTLAGRSTMVVGCALGVAVMGYNLLLKRSAIFGPLGMGLCRALNLILGASVVGVAPPMLVSASAAITAYISAVTYASRSEVRGGAAGFAWWLPALVLIGAMAFFVKHAFADTRAVMAGSFFCAFLLASLAALRGPRPSSIGLMVCALIPLQSSFVLAGDGGPRGQLVAAGLLFLWPLNRLLSRRFHGS